MRGTLHYAPAADVRWMLRLLTPRVIARSAGRYRELELDAAALRRAAKVLARALKGRALTRAEAYAALQRGGVSPAGQRGIHILGHLAQQGLVCFGSRKGKQPTFVLLEEWLPPSRDFSREEALATLAERYFASHGPATAHDFAWWSGLLLKDAQAAIAAAAAKVVGEPPRGGSSFVGRAHPPPGETDDRGPLAALGRIRRGLQGSRGRVRSSVVSADRVYAVNPRRHRRPGARPGGGPWRSTVRVSVTFWNPVTRDERRAVEAAAERYGDFGLGSRSRRPRSLILLTPALPCSMPAATCDRRSIVWGPWRSCWARPARLTEWTGRLVAFFSARRPFTGSIAFRVRAPRGRGLPVRARDARHHLCAPHRPVRTRGQRRHRPFGRTSSRILRHLGQPGDGGVARAALARLLGRRGSRAGARPLLRRNGRGVRRRAQERQRVQRDLRRPAPHRERASRQPRLSGDLQPALVPGGGLGRDRLRPRRVLQHHVRGGDHPAAQRRERPAPGLPRLRHRDPEAAQQRGRPAPHHRQRRRLAARAVRRGGERPRRREQRLQQDARRAKSGAVFAVRDLAWCRGVPARGGGGRPAARSAARFAGYEQKRRATPPAPPGTPGPRRGERAPRRPCSPAPPGPNTTDAMPAPRGSPRPSERHRAHRRLAAEATRATAAAGDGPPE